ncbi:MAG: TlpA family protein disulfide reductase [Spirochaetales bacterium]|nr:TlpA family protein disulfide reductase [Spirochaetales bacterium]
MRRSMFFVLSALLLLSAALPAAELTPEEIRAVGLQPLKEGTAIVDFELEALGGQSRSLSSFKGKVVFLNFWATWCGPCRHEMPSMERLYQRLKDRGLEVVAVNLQEDAKAVERFVSEHGLTFPILLDRTGRVGATYGARSIPITYIVDRDGFVVAGTIGTREWDTEQYVRFFERLLQ